MRFIKKIVTGIFWALLKVFLPAKYYNVTYIDEFLHCKYLKQINLREKVWCFRKGFTPKEFFSYNLKHNDYKKYLSSIKNYKKAYINGRFNDILGNKLLFGEFIRSIINGIDSLKSIDSLAYIDNGNLFSLNSNIVTESYLSIVQCLERNDLILKPIYGNQGKGVFLLRKDNNDYFLDDRKITWEELLKIFRSLKNYLIQERFRQTGFSHDIYPITLNTMRIATMFDKVTKKPFIAYAIQRVGTKGTGYRDNYSQGGIASLIDLNTGILSKGKRLSRSGQIEIFDNHPFSNKPIYNQKIPDWENLSSGLIEMAGRMPYLKYVGWDIILSDNKFFVLEGNVCPGIDAIQIHKPFSEMEQVWNFFKNYEYF